VIKSFEAGDIEEARGKMLYLVEMVKILLKFPPIPAQKAIVKHLGIDLGPCRLPLTTLRNDEEYSLYEQLDGIGFFQKLKNRERVRQEVKN
jgi:N-acetylneuraminate lyase